MLYKALNKKGLAFVEVLSTCQELVGRYLGFRSPMEFYMELKKRVVVKTNPSLSESDYSWGGGFVVGEFVDRDEPSFTETLKEYMLKARGGGVEG
jgi:2-oxoglutarate ferredoxin oxidoreductase subunit beta